MMMPIRLNKKRHPDILRLLAQRKQAQPTESERKAILPSVLDGLNTFSFCEKAHRRAPDTMLCFGPKSLEGDGWVSVVIWYRPKGFYSYKTLTLYGVWAVADADETRIIIGQRILDYTQLPYHAEAYRYRMQNEFTTYYGDNATPPDDSNRFYETLYTPETRLSIRQDIESVVTAHWDTAHTE